MGKFCFIVLHYNVYDETCRCVDSILALNNQEDIEIVLIDNASQNDSYSKLQIRYQNQRVHMLQTKKGLGFSGANNMAYDYAKKLFDMDFVVFTNNDVAFLQEDFVDKVRQEYARSHFALLGPDVYTPKIDLHVSPISRNMVVPMKQLKRKIFKEKIALALFPLYFQFYKRGKVEEVAYDVILEEQENVVLSGSCIICSRDLLNEKEKVFYPETYFYYEEYILAYWCYKNHKKVVFQPSIQVLHFGGVATTTVSNNMKDKLKFITKNDLKGAEVYLKLQKSYSDK